MKMVRTFEDDCRRYRIIAWMMMECGGQESKRINELNGVRISVASKDLKEENAQDRDFLRNETTLV